MKCVCVGGFRRELDSVCSIQGLETVRSVNLGCLRPTSSITTRAGVSLGPSHVALGPPFFSPLGSFIHQGLARLLRSHILTVLLARAGGPETHLGLHRAE